ncbi:dimeric alpha-beta barrel [Whalleya microplaca]|nr:dimeric alpha-beta barrel [Whalleya microplaca]
MRPRNTESQYQNIETLSRIMTVIHIVLFKFRKDVSAAHRQTFVSELKQLKNLPCVQKSRLIVGGPSITEPIEKSRGFHYALVSYHKDAEALAEYQASHEHHRVTSTYFWPFKDDLIRFDFEVDKDDEHMCFPIEMLSKEAES